LWLLTIQNHFTVAYFWGRGAKSAVVFNKNELFAICYMVKLVKRVKLVIDKLVKPVKLKWCHEVLGGAPFHARRGSG
jgi:hypothetical protein